LTLYTNLPKIKFKYIIINFYKSLKLLPSNLIGNQSFITLSSITFTIQFQMNHVIYFQNYKRKMNVLTKFHWNSKLIQVAIFLFTYNTCHAPISLTYPKCLNKQGEPWEWLPKPCKSLWKKKWRLLSKQGAIAPWFWRSWWSTIHAWKALQKRLPTV